MMQERGGFVDHSSINRWAIRFLPLLEKTSRKYKRPVGGNWRMDDTYIKVKGVWKCLYRAVDKEGRTVGFLLTAKRDKAAAKRFLDKAMQADGVPEKITMDKSGANKAAIDEINAGMDAPMVARQVKYLNNIAEQDHRAISCASMLALLRYGSGMPLHRLGKLQACLHIPVPDSTQWDIVEAATEGPRHAFLEMIRQAAQGQVLHNDDIHDLRHSFASFLINAGRTLYEVQNILGHKDSITTQRYAHLSQETLIDAANVVSLSMPSQPIPALQHNPK